MRTRLLVAALFLIVSVFFSRQGHAQGTTGLRVAAMPGFPDLPLDTAYEGQVYSYDLLVVNNTNIFINSTISFMMKVDTATMTFFTNPQTAIQPGDSITITVNGYNFNSPFFKTGNNIVVVWPAVNGLVIQVDTFYTDVFFVPLNSLGEVDLSEPAFHMYPVPSSDFLNIDFKSTEEVECVRIYSATGQLIKKITTPSSNRIDVSQLNPGLYFLEVEANGHADRKKFLKQ